MTRLLATTAILSALWALPAHAQSRAELAAQNAALQSRVERLEARMLTGDPAAERLMGQLDNQETTIRALRGEVERLAYEREQLVSEVDALEGDIRALQTLATRMKIHLDAVDLVAMEQNDRPAPVVDETYVGGPPVISAIPEAPTRSDAPVPMGPLYSEPVKATMGETGKQRLAEGDYAGARDAFQVHLETELDEADRAETLYWLGESHAVLGAHTDAADAYITSMKLAPQGARAPDALVRLAGSLRELGQTAESCNALASFPVQYPDAPAPTRERADRESERSGC